MQKYKCIIVEDEPIAAEVLQDYINQVLFLELRGVCRDAIYAMDLLQKDTIEVIFLDIHLPILKGFDFIKTLKNPPAIIITTAYQEYALQGYDLNVIDYLLKPIEFSRFLTAVNKLRQQGDSPVSPSVTTVSADRPHLFFNVSKRQVKMYIDEILYIESLREYIRITTKEKSILTKMQLGDIEEVLLKYSFLRVHRSFIVSRQKVEAFTPTEIEITGKTIPIGRNYKELVMLTLQNA